MHSFASQGQDGEEYLHRTVCKLCSKAPALQRQLRQLRVCKDCTGPAASQTAAMQLDAARSWSKDCFFLS